MLECKTVPTDQYTREQALAAELNSAHTAPEDVETSVAAHPEGRKRGGVVAVLTVENATVFWDELEEKWYGYNDEDDSDD